MLYLWVVINVNDMVTKINMKKIIKLSVLLLLVNSVDATVPGREGQLAKVGVGDVVSSKKEGILKEDKNIAGDKKIPYDKVVLAEKGKGKVERSMTPSEKKRLAIGKAVMRGVKRVVEDGVLRCVVETWVLSALVGGALLGVKYWNGHLVDANYVDDEVPFDLVTESRDAGVVEVFNPKVVEISVDSGANVNYISVDDEIPFCWTTGSRGTRAVEVFVESDADYIDVDDEVPLYWAVGDGGSEVIEVPVKSGTSVNYLSIDNDVPFDLVAVNRGVKVVKVLERDLVLSKEELEDVFLTDDLDTFKRVAWKSMGMTKDEMLWMTCVHSSLKVALYLIEEGANVNSREEDGTLLHLAVLLQDSRVAELMRLECVSGGHRELCGALGKEDFSLIKLLIDAGADVSSKDKDGRMPLFYALGTRNIDLVKLLVNAGSDITSKGSDGRTVIERGLWLSTWSKITAEEKESVLKAVDYLKSVVEERESLV